MVFSKVISTYRNMPPCQLTVIGQHLPPFRLAKFIPDSRCFIEKAEVNGIGAIVSQIQHKGHIRPILRYMPPAGISVLLSVLCVRAIRQSEHINVPLAVEDLDLYGDQRGALDGRE